MTESPADDAKRLTMQFEQAVRISTGSRLHFGLLDTVQPFGGVGVLIDRPTTEVRVSPSDRLVCDPRAEHRLRAIATRIAQHAGLAELPKCRITVTHRAAAHCGLGSGTQLALASAEALARFLGLALDASTLACQIALRGQRSAVGIHGYFSGGLIYESAQEGCALNPMQQRVELPRQWCVGLFQPACEVASVSGDMEREQFANVAPAGDETGAALQRIVTRQILPAARQGDFTAFASSVHQYNEASGRLFADVQGGAYNGDAVTDVIGAMIDRGGKGVGQSSWGPGVFVWFESTATAEAFVRDLPPSITLIAIAHPRNQPRTLQAS